MKSEKTRVDNKPVFDPKMAIDALTNASLLFMLVGICAILLAVVIFKT